MSAIYAIKRQNHRLHPCDAQRKPELLAHLIAQHTDKRVLVVTSGDPALLAPFASETVTVAEDTALSATAKAAYDLVISYDIPESAIAYMTRLAQAKQFALALLDPAEQPRLYPIETLLGRTILQETLPEFAPEAPAAASKSFKKPKGHKRPDRPTDGTEKTEKWAKQKRKPSRPADGSEKTEKWSKQKHKPSRPTDGSEKTDKWAKPKPKSSRYLGKDADGKAIFSGKSGERNHRYDGTPKSDEEKAAGKKPGKPKSYAGKKAPQGNKPRNAKPAAAKSSRDESAKAAPKRPPRRIVLPPKKPSEQE